MAATDQGPAMDGLVTRAKDILLKPSETWTRIEAEPATVNGLFVGYACILAAIGPLARLIGGQLFGYHALFISLKPSLTAAVSGAIADYVLSLVGVFVLGLLIDALAPNFGGTKSRIQALKVAVYASTASWLAGIFGLFPPLGILSIVGIYSLYLLYLGLPKLMRAPQEKAIAYTAVLVVVYIVIFAVIAACTSAIVRTSTGMVGGVASTGATSAQISVGGAKVDVGKLNAAAAQMQAAANGQSTVTPVAADTLKAMLPQTLSAGYARNELSAESGGVGAIQGASAEGVYVKGPARITLTITDTAGAGALATLGGAVSVQTDRQTPNGYEKVHMDGGRMVSEEWDNASKSGKYSVMVASRFLVAAEGEGADMADLKAAVGQAPLDRLAGMGKG